MALKNIQFLSLTQKSLIRCWGSMNFSLSQSTLSQGDFGDQPGLVTTELHLSSASVTKAKVISYLTAASASPLDVSLALAPAPVFGANDN